MRGKILREPTGTTPGLAMVQGEQRAFALEGVWRSEALPAAGATVDVELSADGRIVAMTLVAESQLQKEQTDAALAAAREKSAALANGLVARLGLPSLVALGVLALSWFFLTAVSYNAGFLGSVDITFWRVLGLINASNPMEGIRTVAGDGGSAGIYGLLGVAALAGPLAGSFWKDRRAELGNVLPLVFMALVVLALEHTLGKMGGGGFASAAEVKEIRAEFMKGISLGAGAYLSVIAAVFLAFKGTKKYLGTRA